MPKARDRAGLIRRVQYQVEYVLVRALAGLVGRMPEPVAVKLGVCLGWTFWALGRNRRRIARRNIERAMPGEHTDAEARRIVKEVFVNIGLTAVETLWMRRHGNREVFDRHYEEEGIDRLQATLDEGAPPITFTGHLGNWELLGAYVATRIGTVNALARPVNNPKVREYTTGLRRQLGLQVISTRDGVRPMLRALKRGETLAVLIDQHVNRAFVPATFFGRKAATTAVVATLAARLDTPVFAVYSLRRGHQFRHRVIVEGPIELERTDDPEADVLANTQRFNDALEAAVRRHPEQWLWTHRRWKLDDRSPRENEVTDGR